MKKFICIILSVMMFGCVVGCGNTNADVEKYDLTIIGREDILKPLASSYKAGRAVKFYLPCVELDVPDIAMSVCLDGIALNRDVTHIGIGAYYEYNFTMPAYNTV